MSRKRTRSSPTVRASSVAEIDYGRLAAEVVKAVRLPAGATATTVPQPRLAPGQLLPGGMLAPSLAPNGWTDPLVAFGPGKPVRPAAIDPVDPASGRPLPRRYEYPVSINLPGVEDRVVPWTMLRRLADVSIVRRCIEIRKAEMVAQEWDIGVSPMALQEALANSTQTPADAKTNKAAAAGDPAAMVAQAAKQNVSVRSVERSLRMKYAADIHRIKTFWKNPDRLNDMNMEDWLMAALEEHFVLDALTVFPHLALDGTLHSFTIIDGSTIKPLLDHRGCIPQAPNPAYQQILHGFPRGEFAATTDATDEYDRDTMIYRPRFRRANSPYGFSNVEQAIVDIDLWMKRVGWIRSEYTDGVIPEMFIQVDVPLTADQVMAYERVYNDQMAGQTEERHRAKVFPQGFTPDQLKNFEERYKPDYDLHLIRLVGNDFDVMPSELGFPPSGGLGGKGLSDGEENIQYRKGSRPLGKWLVNTLNHISAKWLGMGNELTFKFLGLESEDEAAAQEILVSKFHNAGLTANEARDELGLSRFDIEDADVPFIITGRDIVPLSGAVARANAAAMPTPGGGASPGNDTGDSKKTTPNAARPNKPHPTSSTGTVGSTQETKTARAELTQFRKYAGNRMRNGRRWRDFGFEHVPDDLAEQLNKLCSEAWHTADEDSLTTVIMEAML